MIKFDWPVLNVTNRMFVQSLSKFLMKGASFQNIYRIPWWTCEIQYILWICEKLNFVMQFTMSSASLTEDGSFIEILLLFLNSDDFYLYLFVCEPVRVLTVKCILRWRVYWCCTFFFPVEDVQVSCYRILTSLYALGTGKNIYVERCVPFNIAFLFLNLSETLHWFNSLPSSLWLSDNSQLLVSVWPPWLEPCP